jgi:hypothetical protein
VAGKREAKLKEHAMRISQKIIGIAMPVVAFIDGGSAESSTRLVAAS